MSFVLSSLLFLLIILIYQNDYNIFYLIYMILSLILLVGSIMLITNVFSSYVVNLMGDDSNDYFMMWSSREIFLRYFYGEMALNFKMHSYVINNVILCIFIIINLILMIMQCNLREFKLAILVATLDIMLLYQKEIY